MAGWLRRNARAIGDTLLMRDVQPLEGTRMSLFNSQIPNWWAENVNQTTMYATPQLADRVWVASRCKQMNAQQIASMPLRFHGSDREPAWVSNPDPNWFPNGVADAIHAIVDQVYGWGFSCQYVTDFYASGFPRTWTVLDSSKVNISAEGGRREYKYGETELDSRRVVQIDRNPGLALHGTSALRAYAQASYGLLAAQNQAMSVNQGAVPPAVVKSERKLTREQAQAIQASWMEAAARGNGAPRVLGPDLDFETHSFNPADLALLEGQEWNARTIATAYGVPAVLLNMALQGGLTYQNPGALGEMWWRFELRTTATRIANAFTAQMLPAGQWVSFDAADTFLPLDQMSDDDDEQGAAPPAVPGGPKGPLPSQVAAASPSQQPRLQAISSPGG